MPRLIFPLLIPAFLGLPSAALAEVIPFGPNLEARGWTPLTFRSLAPVQFSGDVGRLTIRAEKAASVIWRPVGDDAAKARSAQWRWRVEQGPPPTNLAVKGKDDRAIAVYFAFARDEAAAARAKGSQSLTSAMWWSSGAAIVYVWGGDGARGSVVASPHMGASGKILIRQPASRTGPAFVPEQVDLIGDFRRAFGRDPGPLVGIAISSDSDDTGGTTVAAVEALEVK
jgi:hypothetical protein